MTREIIASKLAYIGLDPSLNGFNYMVEMMLILPEEPLDVCTTYREAAKRFGAKHSSLERCIRHMIERFYDENEDVHPLLRPGFVSGKLTNSQFMYKLRMLLREDTGYFSDGSEWALLECGGNMYEVRVFTAGGNYRACDGSRNKCIKYIMDGGIANVI